MRTQSKGIGKSDVKMKVLMLCHDYPNPYKGDSLRPFNLIKYLSEKHGHVITLLSFKQKTSKSIYHYNLEEYCRVIQPIDIMGVNAPPFKRILYVMKNMISPQNIFSGNFNFLNFYYSPKMQRKINGLLRTEDFDAIYTDGSMASYVDNINLPKIVEPLDASSKTFHEIFLQEQKNPFKKLFWLLQYLKTKKREKVRYKKFDYCIVVTQHDKDILDSYSRDLNITVIPNGVDLSYFKPMDVKEIFPSLIFVGDMGTPPNMTAVSFFYSEIYLLIKKQVPDVKLYLVGRNPSTEISKLSRDESVVVTGYVDDVRPYLAKASVVVTPMILGMGIKNKVLEAMAMEKPVVSTSLGARGIDVSPRENIIIADEPKEFAIRVMELLGDEQLRQKIAYNGKRLVETNYSWKKMVDMLNELFEEIVSKNANK